MTSTISSRCSPAEELHHEQDVKTGGAAPQIKDGDGESSPACVWVGVGVCVGPKAPASPGNLEAGILLGSWSGFQQDPSAFASAVRSHSSSRRVSRGGGGAEPVAWIPGESPSRTHLTQNCRRNPPAVLSDLPVRPGGGPGAVSPG